MTTYRLPLLVSRVIALTLFALTAACGDQYTPAPSVPSSVPRVPQQNLSVPVPASERVAELCPVPVSDHGDILALEYEHGVGTVDPRINLRWHGLSGTPTATLVLPSTLSVYSMIVVEKSNGDEVLMTAGYDSVANRGEVAWWPHTADPTLPVAARSVLVQGAINSIFFDSFVHEDDLLIVDIQCNEIYRLTDSDADGIWDTLESTPFASETLLGSQRPLYLIETGTTATSVKMATGGFDRHQAHTLPDEYYWALVDANSDGVAETMSQVGSAVVNFAPILEDSLFEDLEAVVISVQSETSYRIMAVGQTSNEELATGSVGPATDPANSASVRVIVHLSRALDDGEDVFTENTTHSLEGEHLTVEPTEPSVLVVGVEHTYDAQQVWTGWQLRVYGTSLSTSYKIELLQLGVDAPTSPVYFTLTAATHGSVTMPVPSTLVEGFYIVHVQDAQGVDVGRLDVYLEAP